MSLCCIHSYVSNQKKIIELYDLLFSYTIRTSFNHLKLSNCQYSLLNLIEDVVPTFKINTALVTGRDLLDYVSVIYNLKDWVCY